MFSNSTMPPYFGNHTEYNNSNWSWPYYGNDTYNNNSYWPYYGNDTYNNNSYWPYFGNESIYNDSYWWNYNDSMPYYPPHSCFEDIPNCLLGIIWTPDSIILTKFS